jgi:hypothetical protein
MNVGGSSSDTPSFTLARKSVMEAFQDEILKILLKNSNLTRKQFETLLIDTLADVLLEEEATSRARPKLRTDRSLLSRGSFDRTLTQCRRNIIEAVYTILLLGYTGLFETAQLEPFLEIGGRLKVYVESRGKRNVDEDREMRSTLSKELTEILESLVRGRRKELDQTLNK